MPMAQKAQPDKRSNSDIVRDMFKGTAKNRSIVSLNSLVFFIHYMPVMPVC